MKKERFAKCNCGEYMMVVCPTGEIINAFRLGERKRISKLIRTWHTKYKKGNHWTNALVSELQNKIEEI